MSRVFKRRRRDPRLVMTLPVPVMELLRQVFAELTQALAEPSGAVGDRLYPRAYLDPTEEEAEGEWQSAVHDDLAHDRVEAVGAVLADLAAAKPAGRGDLEVVLDDEGESRWLTVLNDARLTLGTTLGVTEDEPLEFPANDPRAHASDVYMLLTALQGEMVEAMLSEVPEAGTEDG